ncbi:SAV_6107 family HEPN domain-containing protein [Actinocorallia longicatena]|uniref:SAV-6107-like HEPN domain-containing protein n=1 Tax=Actinocorallia longicatena TaxID=111803 RepID=A0ABP6QBF4_9ACTN
MTVHPMPPMPTRRVAPTAQSMLRVSRQLLADAAEATHSGVRYSTAHLAALRAAAAVLTVREHITAPRRGKPRTAWARLQDAEPLLTEWANFFAAGADKRAAAEAGLPNAVTQAEADDLLHDAEVFVTLVEDTLGISTQQSLPLTG